jgi:hypothetical protein
MDLIENTVSYNLSIAAWLFIAAGKCLRSGIYFSMDPKLNGAGIIRRSEALASAMLLSMIEEYYKLQDCGETHRNNVQVDFRDNRKGG